MKRVSVLLVAIALGSMPAAAQTAADPDLLSEINKIRAVDNHTHVSKLVAPGEVDDDFDALPCNILEGGPDPTMARLDNPQFLQAWQKLYGYKYSDREPAHVRELIRAREKVMRDQGDNFPSWVLDQLGTQYLFANRVAMGRGLTGPRFLWVPFDDALMSPLDGTSVSDTPDRQAFYAREAMILKKYMSAANIRTLPDTLDDYIAHVLIPTLEQQKKAGSPAIKFEAAYLRTLSFGTPELEQAKRIYQRYAKGGAPGKIEVLKLQDVLFRVIAREAGRLGLAVHIHTGTGCGTYFDLAGSNPTQLESVLDDVSLRKTTFVLIHGGSGPYTHETSFLLGKPNVYADFSEQDALIPPRALAAVIREWLEWFPEKVLYGTDLAPGPPQLDWDVMGYATNRTARRGLAIALTGMINDGEITRERALEIARMVLRENALKLYGLKN
jgi:uncharacterized protein